VEKLGCGLGTPQLRLPSVCAPLGLRIHPSEGAKVQGDADCSTGQPWHLCPSDLVLVTFVPWLHFAAEETTSEG
jgi:hypothetical protein